MTIISCLKLKKESEALDYQPYPGDIGVKIMENISAEAWQMWMTHQTMLINERHLDLSKSEDRAWLIDQMGKFFNNEEVEQASGFKALD